MRLRSCRFHTQQGAVLFMALIALVALMLAAVALVRSVETSNLVAGNIALKQGALQEADQMMNEAFSCLDKGGKLMEPGVLLSVDNKTICNYYAWLQPEGTEPPYGVPKVLKDKKRGGDDGDSDNASTGNTVWYVIERMCEQTDPPSTSMEWRADKCLESPFGKAAKITGGGVDALPPLQAMYRISVKVSGPRGVTSYSQMVVNASP